MRYSDLIGSQPLTANVSSGSTRAVQRHGCDRPQPLHTRCLKFAVSSSKSSAGSPGKHRGEHRQDFENPTTHDGEVYAHVALGCLPKPRESITSSGQYFHMLTVSEPEITDTRILCSKPGGRFPTPICCESSPFTQPINQSSGTQ